MFAAPLVKVAHAPIATASPVVLAAEPIAKELSADAVQSLEGLFAQVFTDAMELAENRMIFGHHAEVRPVAVYEPPPGYEHRFG